MVRGAGSADCAGVQPCLVALDLDGTLLDHHGHLSEGHVRCVERLRQRGHQVVIVTGRPLLTARALHARLRLASPLVSFNGGHVGVPDGAEWSRAGIPPAVIARVREALRDEPCSLCIYPEPDCWIMDRVIPQTEGWSRRYACAIRIDERAVAGADRPSIKLMVVADPACIGRLVVRLREVVGARCEVVASQDDRIELMPRGVTKASGLQLVAGRLGFHREQVWAVGDADNDVEMVAWAGHGCAMGRATPRLRAAARHHLPSAPERGLCALPLLRG